MCATQNSQSSAADRMRTQTGFADSKVGLLTGASLAGLGFVYDQVQDGPPVARVLLCAAGLALAVATVCLLVVVLPRGGSFGFGTTVAEDESQTASEVDELKKIVCLKFRCLQYAIKAMIVAVLPFLAALIVNAAS